jgi:hypothetical protein
MPTLELTLWHQPRKTDNGYPVVAALARPDTETQPCPSPPSNWNVTLPNTNSA